MESTNKLGRKRALTNEQREESRRKSLAKYRAGKIHLKIMVTKELKEKFDSYTAKYGLSQTQALEKLLKSHK